jgi:hypothetical protein
MRSNAKRLKIGTKVLWAFIFIAVLSSVASGYTIVMLGGRQLQIPDQFTVTRTALTYSVGPTISATVLMAAIDVSATERANHEAPGSLLRRAQALTVISPASSAVAGQVSQRRTITNENLKSYALARMASEAAYERRRIELGLPTLEESRRKAAAADESLAQLLTERSASEQQTREYWQAAAIELRSELAALDAQVDFVRLRLGELPGNPTIGSLVIANSGLSFNGGRRAGAFPSSNIGLRAGGFVTPSLRPQVSGPVGLQRGWTAGGPVATQARGRGIARRLYSQPVFASLWRTDDFSYEASSLKLELDRLLSSRAALEAQQRELEDEARRAGVDPGWLRP